HVSTVIPYNFVNDRETKPGPGFLAVSHERFENRLAHFLGNSRTIIRNGYFNMIVDSSRADLNSRRVCRNRFASILQDVVKSPIKFLGIKPTLSRSFMIQRDLNRPELRPQSNRANGVLHGFQHISISEVESLLCFGEFEKRRNKLGHLLYR